MHVRTYTELAKPHWKKLLEAFKMGTGPLKRMETYILTCLGTAPEGISPELLLSTAEYQFQLPEYTLFDPENMLYVARSKMSANLSIQTSNCKPYLELCQVYCILASHCQGDSQVGGFI